MLPYSSGLYYQGDMDELRILDRALTPGEIAVDYGSSYSLSGDLTWITVTPPTGETLSNLSTDSLPASTSIHYTILDGTGNVLLPNITSGAVHRLVILRSTTC